MIEEGTPTPIQRNVSAWQSFLFELYSLHSSHKKGKPSDEDIILKKQIEDSYNSTTPNLLDVLSQAYETAMSTSGLSDIELQIVRSRFNFMSEPGALPTNTFDSISKSIPPRRDTIQTKGHNHITGSRVQSIYRHALRNLRNSSQMKEISLSFRAL